jgi:hypothetical protein
MVRWLVGRPLIAGMVALFTGAAALAFPAPCESETAVSAAVYKLKAYPLASFAWFPPFPHPGEAISLVSTSTDLTSPITAYAWDVADNGPFGAFNDGGPVATATFATPASHQARLRVTAADHLSSIAVETIHMSAPPPGVLLPFPLVRIVGTDFRSRVRLTLLAVQAPARSRITVSCRGRSCPARSVGRIAASLRGRLIWTRFRVFQRSLSAPLTLEIRVSRNGEIGAYTRFAVRRVRLPLRVDSCLDPAGIRPIACPAS